MDKGGWAVPGKLAEMERPEQKPSGASLQLRCEMCLNASFNNSKIVLTSTSIWSRYFLLHSHYF